MDIFFWQNIPSFHQSSTIRALAAMQDFNVTIIFQDELPKSFQEGGWLVPDFGKAKKIFINTEKDINTIISEAGTDSIHIFSGIRFKMIRKAFLFALQIDVRIGLIAEAPDWRGLSGFARLLLYKIEFLRFRRKIDFILAIGEIGVRWYLRCGFPPEKLYPYLYTVERTSIETEFSLVPEPVRLIYVGRLVKLKGLDILISSLLLNKHLSWQLDLVGDGPERGNLLSQVRKAGLSARIKFHGVLQNNVALQMIARSDCLVLPSRKDGWGAVVNESLMQGVPVICSDACGAADFLDNALRGEVFKSGSVTSLAEILARWIAKGNKSQQASYDIKVWSRAIEGNTVAEYLCKVFASIYTTKKPT